MDFFVIVKYKKRLKKKIEIFSYKKKEEEFLKYVVIE